MTSPRAPVLVVSKPLAPPWTDGSKNHARDLVVGARALGRPMQVFAPARAPALDGARVRWVPDAALSRGTSLAMLAALATERDARLWHFVFAPSARTRRIAGALASVRRRATVQTIASAPPAGVRLDDVVFADRVVALSRATYERALAEGVVPARLRRVALAIEPPPEPAGEEVDRLRRELGLEGRFVITFPGDLEHGDGARVLFDAVSVAKGRGDVTLVLACRDKTSRAAAIRAELAAAASRARVALRHVGETPHLHALLVASDLVALPADTLYAKVDHPLVLLEAMHLGRPVLVTRGTSAAELAEEGGALASEHDAASVARAIDELVADSARRHDASVRARAHARTRTIEAMARAYDSIYDELAR